MRSLRSEVPSIRSSAVVLVALLAASPPVAAGLWFWPVGGPEGADTYALAGDGATLWAGTYRGVWRLSSGQWTFDGLPDRTVSGIAVADGSVWGATGDGVYRRAADGTWNPETLPGGVSLPAVLLADGSTLYAGGLGVARRAGGSWSALPSPGGFVTALGLFSGDLVAGIFSNGAVRFTGGAWVPMSAGMGLAEGAQAFAVLGGVLWAGTSKGIYSWNGAAWLAETGFGVHAVRGLTSANGTLRAATLDAGLFMNEGMSWKGDNGEVLYASARCFGTLGSELYAGMAGSPVYRNLAGGWTPAGTGLNAAIVSEVAGRGFFSEQPGDHFFAFAASRGAGVVDVTTLGNATPAGCGDVRTVSEAPGALFTAVAATNCGPLFGGAGGFAPAGAGFPSGTGILSLASTADGVLAGTDGAGVYRYVGSLWSADSNGFPGNASVQSVRGIAAGTFAGSGTNVFLRDATGTWNDVSNGLPEGTFVQALGGGTAAFASLAGGGIYRRDGSSPFRRDAAGLGASPVFSFDFSNRRAIAAAGLAGVFRKKEGGWQRETAGLPTGSDIRVARNVDAYSHDWGISSYVIAGTSGSGTHFASTQVHAITLPVVLDLLGSTGARFRTELTVGNRGSEQRYAVATFIPAPEFGASAIPAGSAGIVLPPGTEFRAADALDFLRERLFIPPATSSNPIAGSLVVFSLPVQFLVPPATSSSPIAGSQDFLVPDTNSRADGLYAIARTYTTDASGGSYGLFYDAPSDLDAAEEEASVYGLRSISGLSRSNLAAVHIPGRTTDPITLSVQVYSANGAPAGAPLTKTLAPGEWYQWNGILPLAGLPDGSYGYARITRVSGVGPWIAYGVVNDAATSDGSYLPAFRPGGLTAARRLIVPVVLDVYGQAGSHFTTELTLVNDGTIATPVDLVYRPAPGFGSAPGVPVVTVNLAARMQRTIPDIIQYLREHGVQVPDPRTAGAQAGTLSVEFRFLTNLDSPRTLALARTTTPNPNTDVGGSFGLFYPAAAHGGGARKSAIVPALTQNDSVRSNLAVVHLGGGSELPMTLSVQLHDASTGAPVGNALSIVLNPGDWYQWSKVIEATGAIRQTSKAYAVITRTSGDDTFLAYGVLNDSVTSDGSYLAMIPDDLY